MIKGVTLLDIKLDFNELCEVFKIDEECSVCDFVKNVDLIRKEYKVSQSVFCDMVGISRSLYSQCKKGLRGLSNENKLKMLKELAKIKELSCLEERSARMTISNNVSKGLGKYSLEKSISESDPVREMKEALWKTVQAKQKIKRNSKYFQPSLDASVDKITLFVRLVATTEVVFLKVMERFGIVSGNTKYTHNGRYKSGKVTEYAHIWQYEGPDCKVHVQYMFFDKRIGENVRELKVEFNPNKWDIAKNEMLIALAPFLSRNPRIKEFDVCKDFYGFTDADVVMPKELFDGGSNNIKVFADDNAKTIYFGDKNKTVNLMIYDKRKEILKKDNKDIGFDCLRAETRYKLKPSEYKKINGLETLIEYRVKLSDIDKIKLPIKTYCCQAHLLRECDIESSIKPEDRLILKGVLNGGLNQHYIMSIDKSVAERIDKYLEDVYIETLTIAHADVLVALNSFVFKYLSCIDKFYNIGAIEGFSEIWKMKKNNNDFEVIGTIESWQDVLSDDFELIDSEENDGYCSTLILSRDENF